MHLYYVSVSQIHNLTISNLGCKWDFFGNNWHFLISSSSCTVPVRTGPSPTMMADNKCFLYPFQLAKTMFPFKKRERRSRSPAVALWHWRLLQSIPVTGSELLWQTPLLLPCCWTQASMQTSQAAIIKQVDYVSIETGILNDRRLQLTDAKHSVFILSHLNKLQSLQSRSK